MAKAESIRIGFIDLATLQPLVMLSERMADSIYSRTQLIQAQFRKRKSFFIVHNRFDSMINSAVVDSNRHT